MNNYNNFDKLENCICAKDVILVLNLNIDFIDNIDNFECDYFSLHFKIKSISLNELNKFIRILEYFYNNILFEGFKTVKITKSDIVNNNLFLKVETLYYY